MQHMSPTARRTGWQLLAAFGLLLCLLAFTAHPVSALAIQLCPFILLPVFLFGLILAPRFLWPARDDQQFRPLVLSRAALFQRPPQFSEN